MTLDIQAAVDENQQQMAKQQVLIAALIIEYGGDFLAVTAASLEEAQLEVTGLNFTMTNDGEALVVGLIRGDDEDAIEVPTNDSESE